MVGASSTATACLEGLVFTPYLNFTSLTLVSPDGIPPPNDAPQTETPGAYASGGGEGIHGKAGVATTGGETKTPASSMAEGAGADHGPDMRRDSGCRARLTPHDEDAPDVNRFARLSLERHVRIVR